MQEVSGSCDTYAVLACSVWQWCVPLRWVVGADPACHSMEPGKRFRKATSAVGVSTEIRAKTTLRWTEICLESPYGQPSGRRPLAHLFTYSTGQSLSRL